MKKSLGSMNIPVGRLFKKSHKPFCDQSGSAYGFMIFRLSEDVFERSELSEC